MEVFKDHTDITCTLATQPGVRLSISALVGDPDLNPRVYNFLVAILGSVSQVPVNSQVPMGPQILESTYKYSWY